MLVMDWCVSLAMAAAGVWLFGQRQKFGAVVVAVGSVALAALALVVGGLLFFSLRAVGAVVGVIIWCVVAECGKSIYARMR